MNQERLLQVLIAPHVSEKTVGLGELPHKQVAFKVLPSATKAEIKAAVELVWANVKVESVSTVNVKGKIKRFGRLQGRRKDWKKAYVTLAAGSDIDFENLG